MAGGHRVPEDLGKGKPGTPYQQDVFLAGALVWTLLSGRRLATEDKTPVWSSAAIGSDSDVPQAFTGWFERCLSLDAQRRYADGVEAADAFADLVRKGQGASLERQLERYRLDVDPISDYVPLKWIVQKPYRIYRSAREGRDLFVKSWPERSLGERRKSAARLIEFFARAELLQLTSADWAPRLELACLCADGLLLVQEWIEGRSLADTDTAAWDIEDLRTFISAVITAVDKLHEAGMTHGDLSPNNIMLRAGELRPKPVLVDLVDFSSDEQGKKTPAYCPPHDVDLRVRDRFAVCEMSKELAERIASDDATAILAAVAKCREGDTPWLTLKPLKDALSPPQEKPQLLPLNLTVDTRRTPFEGEMLSDNGKYHLVQSRAKHALEIFGFDQRVTVELDPADGKPLSAFASRIDARSLDWAQNRAFLAFEGRVDVRRSSPTRFAGFEGLLERVRNQQQSSPEVASNIPEAAIGSVPAATPLESAPVAFPIVRFWRETIAIEEEIQPEIKLVEAPKFDAEELVLTCEDSASDFEVAEGQSVTVT